MARGPTILLAAATLLIASATEPFAFESPDKPPRDFDVVEPMSPALLPRMPVPPVVRGERATRIIVEKSWRLMVVESNRKVRRIYSIGLGDEPLGHKEQRGDSRTPEGRYWINFKHDKSRYHLALRVSYPNDTDRARARKLRVHPGSDIMIHGTPNGVEWWRTLLMERDWTDGCVAVTNNEIEEIWALVRVGTRVDIRP